jgi:SAM-dependent methyltransferase
MKRLSLFSDGLVKTNPLLEMVQSSWEAFLPTDVNGFEDESIAGIIAFYAAVHFSKEQVAKAFREIFRVLQPGGVFLFTSFIYPNL